MPQHSIIYIHAFMHMYSCTYRYYTYIHTHKWVIMLIALDPPKRSSTEPPEHSKYSPEGARHNPCDYMGV